MKLLTKTIAALCVLALVASACSSGSSTDASGDTDTAESNESQESSGDSSGEDKDILIGLVTKTNDNPFFVKMRNGAEAKSEELGVELQSFAGEGDGDNESQVQAVENLISAGADGILITPSDPVAIAPTLQKAQDEGILVIALDTPTDPPDAVSQTFATDNFKAGELIGEWAKETMGDDAETAKIALLDLNPNQVTVDVARNQGFLSGFGIDLNDESRIGDEVDDRIVGNDVTNGNEEGGRTAMENLLRLDSEINLVYTINEPAAAGAVEALKAVGREDEVLIVSVDGGCPGVKNIADGVIDATSMQFPLDMASLGVEAVVEFVDSGEVPGNSDGLDFFNTGVELVTDAPVDGLSSIDTTEGLERCWG